MVMIYHVLSGLKSVDIWLAVITSKSETAQVFRKYKEVNWVKLLVQMKSVFYTNINYWEHKLKDT